MEASTLISTISLLLSAYTLFICYCIYNQDRNILTQLSQGNTRFAKDISYQMSLCCLSSESQISGGYRCDNTAQYESIAENALASGQLHLASDCFKAIHLCNETDTSALLNLAEMYSSKLNDYNSTVELLRPYYSLKNKQPSAVLQNTRLTCIYMQSLLHNNNSSSIHASYILQLVDYFQEHHVAMDECSLTIYHVALSERKYYADAYSNSKEFVRKYPNSVSSHLAMGEALLALERITEARSVLNVANMIVTENGVVNTEYQYIRRLGDAYYRLNITSNAEYMYTHAYSMLPSSTDTYQRCQLLLRTGQLRLKLNETESAYIALLSCLQHCPKNTAAILYLGQAQLKLGLLHDAEVNLEASSRIKTHRTESRAALKALKTIREEEMREQVRRTEEELGPQPPVDPNIIRQKPNGTYVDFIARMEREKVELERVKKEQEEKLHIKQSDKQSHSEKETGTSTSSATTTATTSTTSTSTATPTTNTTKPIHNDPNLTEEERTARGFADQFIALADAFIEKGDLIQARRQLNRAVKRAPQYTAPYLTRAGVLRDLGFSDLAIIDLHKIYLELDRNNTTSGEILRQMARDFALAGQIDRAESILQPMNLSLPVDLDFCVGQALHYRYVEDLPSAIASLKRLDPSVVIPEGVIGMLVQMLEKTGDKVEAERVLHSNAEAKHIPWMTLGEFYMRHSNTPAAIAAIETHLTGIEQSDSTKKDQAKAHKKLCTLYAIQYESDSVDEVRAMHLETAYTHCATAVQLGTNDYEVKKFYSKYPAGSSKSTDSTQQSGVQIEGTTIPQ